jgi:hypothetical protein
MDFMKAETKAEKERLLQEHDPYREKGKKLKTN